MTILTATDEELWALCVWRETRGESSEAKLGVAYVIHNRSVDAKHRWPRTVRRVILQPQQFSSFNPSDVNYRKYPAADEPAWADSKAAVQAVKGEAPDPTKGANFYHSFRPGDPHWPWWATPEKLTAQIGAFHFYRR